MTADPPSGNAAPVLSVLVNHVGYDDGRFIRAVVQVRGDADVPETAVLRDSGGRVVAKVAGGPATAVPGWRDRRFRVFELTLPDGGPYVMEASSDSLHAVSAPFSVGPGREASLISDLLAGLSAVRSSGSSDEADRRVPFFGGRPGTVDVHGGWYDASGDTSKYLSHLSYANVMNPQQTPLVVWALLDALEHLEAGSFALGPRLALRFREEAAWGADFLVRMQDPEGYFYTTVFDRWSKDLEARRICAFRGQSGQMSADYAAGYRQGGGMAVAALARAAALGLDLGDYGPDRYRRAAESGWRHLEEHGTEYLDDRKENIIDDTCALMAAVELEALGVQGAGQAAGIRVESLIGRWDSQAHCFRADAAGDWSWFHASDEALPLVALMRALEVPAVPPESAEAIRSLIPRVFDAELARAGAVANPFIHPRRHIRTPTSPSRDAFFYPHDNPSGYWWQGENARLASWAAAARRWTGMAAESAPPDLERFAAAQVSWILGMNPFDACMLKGRGRNNPDYEWDHFNLPGGVSNGITSGMDDEADIAFRPPEAEGRGDHTWRWGEQWIPHAASLLLAVSRPARGSA